MRGGRIEVAQCVQRALLRGNGHVASRSRDMFGFRDGDAARAGDVSEGGNGDVETYAGRAWGSTMSVRVHSGSVEAHSPM